MCTLTLRKEKNSTILHGNVIRYLEAVFYSSNMGIGPFRNVYAYHSCTKYSSLQYIEQLLRTSSADAKKL